MNLEKTILLLTFIVTATVSAELPKPLFEQFVKDAKLLQSEQKKGSFSEGDLKKEADAIYLSPGVVADYESGKVLVSSLELQEEIKDLEEILRGVSTTESGVGPLYIKMSKTTVMNHEQRILCYLVVRSVKRQLPKLIASEQSK